MVPWWSWYYYINPVAWSLCAPQRPLCIVGVCCSFCCCIHHGRSAVPFLRITLRLIFAAWERCWWGITCAFANVVLSGAVVAVDIPLSLLLVAPCHTERQ